MKRIILLIAIILLLSMNFSYANVIEEDSIKRAQIDKQNINYVGEMYFLEGKYFAVLHDMYNYYFSWLYSSEDGENWEYELGMDHNLLKIFHNGSQYVAIGTNEVSFSKDGLNWEKPIASNLNDIIEGKVYKEDADNERKVNLVTKTSEGIFYSDSVQDVTFHKGKYIACCKNSGRIIISDDAVNWRELTKDETEVGLGGRQYFDIISNGETVVAGGNAGKRALSNDGVYWIDATTPQVYRTMNETAETVKKYNNWLLLSKDIENLLWDGKQFIALADGNGFGNDESITISTSLDGSKWDLKKVMLNDTPVISEWNDETLRYNTLSGSYERAEQMVWTGTEYLLLKSVYTYIGNTNNNDSYWDRKYVLMKSKDLNTWSEMKRFNEEEKIKSIMSDGKNLYIGGQSIYIMPFSNGYEVLN